MAYETKGGSPSRPNFRPAQTPGTSWKLVLPRSRNEGDSKISRGLFAVDTARVSRFVGAGGRRKARLCNQEGDYSTNKRRAPDGSRNTLRNNQAAAGRGPDRRIR